MSRAAKHALAISGLSLLLSLGVIVILIALTKVEIPT